MEDLKMYSDDVKKIYKKQIEVYRKFINVLQNEVAPVIENWNGKKFTQRFIKALEKNQKNKTVRYFKDSRFTNIELEIHCQHEDRYIIGKTGNAYYIDTGCINIQVCENDIIQKEVYENGINNQIEYLVKRIKDIQFTIDNIDKAKQEYNDIQRQIHEYRLKYDMNIMDKMGEYSF